MIDCGNRVSVRSIKARGLPVLDRAGYEDHKRLDLATLFASMLPGSKLAFGLELSKSTSRDPFRLGLQLLLHMFSFASENKFSTTFTEVGQRYGKMEKRKASLES